MDGPGHEREQCAKQQRVPLDYARPGPGTRGQFVGMISVPDGDKAMSIEFLITTLIVVVSPGTGALYTIAAGLSRGSKASLWAAFGCTLGIVPHMLAAITGLAAILHTSALAFEIIKYLGVAYLLYMAWATLRETGALSVEKDVAAKSAGKVIVESILINILNPKLSIFFFAFLPQFVPAATPNAVVRMLELSGVFMAMTFVVFAIYGLFAAAIRGHVISRPAIMVWMRRTFAGAFVLLGAKLAFTER
jgi:threonine/homoserine/homoserine lactone efflux protein